MKEFKVKHLTIYQAEFTSSLKYRKEVSTILTEKYGQGPFSSQEKTREIITFLYNYFCDKFIEICHSENSVRFYQLILSQHEQTIEIAHLGKPSDLPDGLTMEYIAIYRRTLKWILEQACDTKLYNQEIPDKPFLERAKSILDELAYIGHMIFTCASIYAEQDMIEDVAEIDFDHVGLFRIQHKHHYDFILRQIQESFGAQLYKHVVDQDPVEDLKKAIERCFQIKYEYLGNVIAEIHKMNEPKGGQYLAFGWESLPLGIETMFRVDAQQARVLFAGLTLDRNNKLPLHDLACKPQSMFRYLYRPILIWNIEGANYAIVGENGYTESIIQLCTNCIPWGKAPAEWMGNKCFSDYVHSKEDEHDKWLDDEVEQRLSREGLHYYRNITFLNSYVGGVTLNTPGVGEIDFIIINHQLHTIYIADCKHLQGRYDMMTQKNDYSNFVKDEKGYNAQIKKKIDFISGHLSELTFHNKAKYGPGEPDLLGYEVEGIFIINTPTFYMFNSDYRIYTVNVFMDLITRRKIDPELTVLVDKEDEVRIFKIQYPYFRKPDYKLTDLLNLEDVEPVCPAP